MREIYVWKLFETCIALLKFYRKNMVIKELYGFHLFKLIVQSDKEIIR